MLWRSRSLAGHTFSCWRCARHLMNQSSVPNLRNERFSCAITSGNRRQHKFIAPPIPMVPLLQAGLLVRPLDHFFRLFTLCYAFHERLFHISQHESKLRSDTLAFFFGDVSWGVFFALGRHREVCRVSGELCGCRSKIVWSRRLTANLPHDLKDKRVESSVSLCGIELDKGRVGV